MTTPCDVVNLPVTVEPPIKLPFWIRRGEPVRGHDGMMYATHYVPWWGNAYIGIVRLVRTVICKQKQKPFMASVLGRAFRAKV